MQSCCNKSIWSFLHEKFYGFVYISKTYGPILMEQQALVSAKKGLSFEYTTFL